MNKFASALLSGTLFLSVLPVASAKMKPKKESKPSPVIEQRAQTIVNRMSARTIRSVEYIRRMERGFRLAPKKAAKSSSSSMSSSSPVSSSASSSMSSSASSSGK